MSALLSRRLFLRQSASAGAVAIVPAACAAVTPEARARRAWAEFCDAMRALCADADGWVLYGAGERWEAPAAHSVGRFIVARSVSHVWEPDTRLVAGGMWVERHQEVTL